MRPWLVVVGVSFLVVGGGALLSLLLSPAPSVTQQSTSQLDGQATPAASRESVTVPAANASHGTLTLRWSSSALVAVRLLLPCASGVSGCSPQTLASWSWNTSGSISIAGTMHWEYVLTWATPVNATAVFAFSTVARWEVQSSPPVADLIAEVASGLLAAVGAVALFLGLFLRRGFRRPAPVVSRSADDVEGIAGATGPRTERSDAGSARPPPRPPSRSA